MPVVSWYLSSYLILLLVGILVLVTEKHDINTSDHWHVIIKPHASLKIIEEASKITLNANELEISVASITVTTTKTEQTQSAKSINYNKSNETAIFEFDHALPAASTAVLHMEFIGHHNDQLAGFYRSAYTDEKGNKK